MDIRRFFQSLTIIVLVGFLFSTQVFAQAPEREYVIAIGDQLDIQVWNQVQPLPNFSARLEVRSDRMITMPWLGDIRVAGLKKSTLTERLEGKELLGKYLTEPHVTITPLGMAENVRVFFSGVVTMEQEMPREVRLGAVLQGLLPKLQQYNPNPDAIQVRSAEGEEFPTDPNLRLQWGDEIIIPSQEVSLPTPVTPTQPVPVQVKFTPEEYQEFQQVLEEYPEAQQLLQQVATIEEDGSILLHIEKIPEDLLQELPEALLPILEQHAVLMQTPTPPPQLLNAQLLGIRLNLLAADGLHEAFLVFPDPDSEEVPVIKAFREGDIIQPGDAESEAIILAEIDEDTGQVIVKQGEEMQALPLQAPFSSVALSGILTFGGKPQAVLEGLLSSTSTHPIQRKRYKEGELIGPDVRLAKILEDEDMIVLQKGQEIQLVFLHDPARRVAPTPPPSPSPVATPEEPLPEALPLPEEQPSLPGEQPSLSPP